MTPVSRKKLPEKTDKQLNDVLVNALEKLSSNDLSNTLSILLTETEIKMLKKRIGIIMMLNRNISIDEISKVMNVTRQTISRIDLQLKLIPKENSQKLTDRLSLWSNKNNIKLLLKETANLPSPTIAIRNSARRTTGT